MYDKFRSNFKMVTHTDNGSVYKTTTIPVGFESTIKDAY